MFTYTYDGTFEGLLTVVFESYERKAKPVKIVKISDAQPALFTQTVNVVTDEVKAERVWKGLLTKISETARTNLYKVYLSEQLASEILIYDYMALAFASNVNIEENFAADCVREVAQINKQIFREKHRMEAFIRFQKTADDLYYATIEPDFNVIPLLIEHFEKRYADQRWLIYDVKRKYGIFYDLDKVEYVQLDALQTDRSGNLPFNILEQNETLYQELWQTYFHHVNIPERKNRKLHLRHVPMRYWKYLPEKRPTTALSKRK